MRMSHWLLLATLCTSLGMAAPVRREFPLDSLRLAACQVRDGRLTLGEWFAAGDSDTIAVEAEDALELIADPPTGTAQAECSGGRGVAKVDRALFPVCVSRAGRYVRWSRAFFPQGGGWCHSESMDYGEARWTTDCDGETAGRWVWVKGPVYDLAPGIHLLWLHNWHGGALLDKVVLAREGSPAPEGLGPAGLRRSPARSGWALTPPLSVPGLSRLSAAEWERQAGAGEVTLSLSTDGGRSFSTVGGGPLPVTAGVGGVPAALLLRAELRAAADGTSPGLGIPAVSYEVDAERFAVLENELVRVTVLRDTGGLVGLYDKTAGVECLPGADGQAPFELRQLPPGASAPVPIPTSELRLTRLDTTEDGASAHYRVGEGTTAVVSLRLVGRELSFTLAANNQSGPDIVEVACPLVRGFRLGAGSSDDRLILPNWQGGTEVSDPAHSGGGTVRYPAGGAMAWLDLYEPRPAHGVYLASHDPTLLGSELRAAAQAEAGTLALGVTRYVHLRPGRDWTSPAVVVGVHGGDWHTAADAYREYAQSWMKKPQPPEWVREADGWYGLVVSASSSRVPFRRLPEFLKPMREMGTNTIQVWGQMTGGNNCDSLPYPNPVLGTLDEFKAAVREVQRWGAHITFYVSSQFWKVTWGDVATLGDTPRSLLPPTCPIWDWSEWRRYALRSYGGECSGDTRLAAAEQERYGTPWLRTVPCPFTEAWAKRHLYYWCVSQYGESYGADGIYLDETCAASERICFAPDHGHVDHGIWGASLARTMEQMVAGGRARNPEWAFAMEGCGDAIGQFADMHLISPASARKRGLWGATKRFAPEVFHYTFPDYILYDGVANGTYGIAADDVVLRVHLQGNRYDSFSAQPAGRLIALRQRTKQLLYRARFMDNVGLASSDEAVEAKLSVLQDAANDVRIINLINPQARVGATVTVEVGEGGPLAGYSFDLEGQQGPLAVSREGTRAVFTAPLSRAATVLISTRCEPLVRVPVATAFTGEGAELEVVLTNPGDRDVSGQLSTEAATAGAPSPQVPVAVRAGAVTSVRLPVAVPPGAGPGCLRGHVTLRTGAVTVRRPYEVLLRSPFEVTAALRQSHVRLIVTNRSQAAHSGTLEVAGVLWPVPVSRPFSAGAAATTSVELPLAGASMPTAPVELRVALTCAGRAEAMTAWLSPIVSNGGFEVTGPEGRPASWSYQSGDRATVDPEGAAEGKTCLKLAGKRGAFLGAHQSLHVEAGGSYEVRCRMRRSAGTAAAIGPQVVVFPQTGAERYFPLRKVSTLPDEQWNEYALSFTVPVDARDTQVYLYNVNSDATVWFDDVQIM